jgi:hypothetical protein
MTFSERSEQAAFTIQSTHSGQALIEYLILFSFIAGFSVKMVENMSTYFNDFFTSLAFVLSQYLSVGVCSQDCFFGNYIN